MKSAVNLDVFIDRTKLDNINLVALGDGGYADPSGRPFWVENTNLAAITEGTFQVIPEAGGLRDLYTNTGHPVARNVSTEWQDFHAYHGCSYLICSAIRMKPGVLVQPSGIYLGFSKNIGE